MEGLLSALLMITGFFVVFLILQSFSKLKFCALCGAAMLSWLILLLLYWKGIFTEPLMIALLMGTSITGAYYLAEKRVPERFTLFRLPFLLTLIILGFLLLRGISGAITGITLVVLVWLVFLPVYFSRRSPKIRQVAKKIIGCCKGW